MWQNGVFSTRQPSPLEHFIEAKPIHLFFYFRPPESFSRGFLTNFLESDSFNNGGICSLSSTKSFLEERRIPRNLVKAVVRARETSEVQKKFHEEMDRYIDKCKRGELKPKVQWLNLLRYLAEGREIMSILDALQVHPNSEDFLKILEALKAHGFPEYFVNDLISEIPLEFLTAPAKDKLRSLLHLSTEF